MWELTLIAGLAIAGTGVWMALRKRPQAPGPRDSDTGVHCYAGDGHTGTDNRCIDALPADCADANGAGDSGGDSCGDGGSDGGGGD